MIHTTNKLVILLPPRFLILPHSSHYVSVSLCSSMASNYEEDDTMNESQEVVGPTNDLEELRAQNKKLLQENKKLQQTAKASEFIDNLSEFMKNRQKNKNPSEPPADTGDGGSSPSSQTNPQPTPNQQLPEHLAHLKPTEKTDNFGLDIAQNICDILQQCWQTPYRKEEIIDALDAQVRPGNALAFKHLEVNNITMNKTDKIAEKDMRYIGNAICGAGKSLAYMMDMLTTAEGRCRQISPKDEGKLVLNEMEFDFPEANRLLAQSMKILGMANVQTGQARCSMLAHKFKDEFKKLCDPANPFVEGKFFGPTLDTATALIANQNKVQKAALETPKSTRLRGNKRWNYRRNYPTTSMLQAAVMQQALTAAQPQQFRQQQPALPTAPVATNTGFLGVPQFYNPQPQPLIPQFNQFLHNRGCSKGRGCGHGRGHH